MGVGGGAKQYVGVPSNTGCEQQLVELDHGLDRGSGNQPTHSPLGQFGVMRCLLAILLNAYRCIERTNRHARHQTLAKSNTTDVMTTTPPDDTGATSLRHE
jgi:hypothetical protein